MLLLALACDSALADWLKMGQVEKSSLLFLTSATVYYIDPTSIDRNGNIRKVWEIRDLADKGSHGERSVLASVEYDCAEKQMRTLSSTGHTRRMATGEIIDLGRVPDDWIPLRRGKDFEVFYKILEKVCAP
ncbi:MAG: surface-adhesin E family protein [Burkholderiales bacterium]